MTQSPQEPSFQERIPEGDNRLRLVCNDCGWIHYENPRIIVGTVSTWEGRVLLCRRAIPPREGFWTIPAGFLEEHETPEEGALRETLEEAEAQVRATGLLAVYSVPRISQVHLIYSAHLVDGEFGAGPESLETKLVDYDKIPWGELAFPTVRWALEHHGQLGGRPPQVPFTNPRAAHA